MMVGPAIQHVQGRLSGISPKMLTRTLRQLEPASLLTIFPGVPPGVEYALAERGASAATGSRSFATGLPAARRIPQRPKAIQETD
jgi:hypothetical protein